MNNQGGTVKKIVLANPRGFCAGVDRAIEIVNRALELFGAPVYVRHEVVHNRTVVESLKQKGVVFVDQLDEVPEASLVIFSAHGVSSIVQQEAKNRNLKVFDATCPLVTKVHLEVAKSSENGHECILIGHSGHPEVEGTMGQFDTSRGGKIHLVETEEDVDGLEIQDPMQLSYVTQTTLSVDDTRRILDRLKKKFPDIQGPRIADICYATQNRQDAVKSLTEKCDLILVVGSANSSNSNRLKELAERRGTVSYLIDDVTEICMDWFKSSQVIGVTAGASAPESLVQEVVDHLESLGAARCEESSGKAENLVFSLPRELR
jgi:4-hydroxy-3-methylbut-2-enyl diphosphate reductase